MKTACTLTSLLLGLFTATADDYQCVLPWALQVVDDHGQPVARCTVMQEWGYNFAGAATNFTAEVATDPNGRVQLPARGVAYPKTATEKFLDRVTVRNGLGPWASLYVYKQGYEGQWVYSKNDFRAVYTTNGIFSRIVLKPAKSAP
jgi:hypothetical protein